MPYARTVGKSKVSRKTRGKVKARRLKAQGYAPSKAPTNARRKYASRWYL